MIRTMSDGPLIAHVAAGIANLQYQQWVAKEASELQKLPVVQKGNGLFERAVYKRNIFSFKSAALKRALRNLDTFRKSPGRRESHLLRSSLQHWIRTHRREVDSRLNSSQKKQLLSELSAAVNATCEMHEVTRANPSRFTVPVVRLASNLSEQNFRNEFPETEKDFADLKRNVDARLMFSKARRAIRNVNAYLVVDGPDAEERASRFYPSWTEASGRVKLAVIRARTHAANKLADAMGGLGSMVAPPANALGDLQRIVHTVQAACAKPLAYAAAAELLKYNENGIRIEIIESRISKNGKPLTVYEVVLGRADISRVNAPETWGDDVVIAGRWFSDRVSRSAPLAESVLDLREQLGDRPVHAEAVTRRE